MRSLCSKTLGATAEAPARNAKRTQRRKPLGSRRALPRLEAGEGTLVEWKAVIMLSPESRAEAEQPWQLQELCTRRLPLLTTPRALISPRTLSHSHGQSLPTRNVWRVAVSPRAVSHVDRPCCCPSWRTVTVSNHRAGGILEQLKDEISVGLFEAQQAEEDRAGLIVVKKKEIATLTATTEAETKVVVGC